MLFDSTKFIQKVQQITISNKKNQFIKIFKNFHMKEVRVNIIRLPFFTDFYSFTKVCIIKLNLF